METRVNYALVGLFVLGMAALWVAVGIWLLFGNPTVSYDTYYTYMNESVSGLYEDSAVRYYGVEVGKVADIELVTSEQVRLVLDISKEAPVKVDTKATLRSQGLTGFYYVELIGGSVDAPLLKNESGDEIPVIESVPSLFMRLDQAVTGVMDSLSQVSDKLDLVLSDENIESLNTTLTSVAQISAAVASHSEAVESIIADLSTLTGTVAARAQTIDQAISDFSVAADNMAAFSQGLSEIRADIQTMAQRLSDASAQLESLVEDSAPGVRRFTTTTLANVNQAVLELRNTLESLNRLSRQLEAQPNALIVGAPKREPGPGEDG